MNVPRRASPSGFLPNIETSSDRSCEFPDTSCVRGVDMRTEPKTSFRVIGAGISRSCNVKWEAGVKEVAKDKEE